MMRIRAEYLWLDGAKPPGLRSKTKILPEPVRNLADVPAWNFDGSSTEQAEGSWSDRTLQPVFLCPDPIRAGENVLVLSEVLNPDGSLHPSNTRARFRRVAEEFAAEKPLFGFEQEYTLFRSRNGHPQDLMPLAWPENGAVLKPQGPYYCGVGADRVFGRELMEQHTEACLRAGLTIAGTNGEVMPGQWEFQIGPVGVPYGPDELWVARWLLSRIAERMGIVVSFAPKPQEGDWNGAGCHANFSTERMREAGGIAEIKAACEKLALFHKEHLKVYGEDNLRRLTGKHETASFDKFFFGVGHRGASVRIPAPVANAGCGYLEDRRPAANMDPYLVATALLETICGSGFRA